LAGERGPGLAEQLLKVTLLEFTSH